MAFSVIPPSGWKARPPSEPLQMIPLPVPEVWIHHTVTASGPDETQIMRQIQNYHMDTRGWRDIGYSFVIFPTGRIYEGRGWGRKGAHTQNHNAVGHGIAFAGDYRTLAPTTPSLDACRWLIAEGQRLGFVAKGKTLPTGGHRDVAATACPGDKLYAQLGYLRVPPYAPTPTTYHVYFGDSPKPSYRSGSWESAALVVKDALKRGWAKVTVRFV